MTTDDQPVRRSPGAGPPRLPFVLTVGVTGHRLHALDNGEWVDLEQRIRGALHAIAQNAAAIRTQESAFYAADPLRLLFVSPIADGADQIAAEVALSLGFELHVVLPFDQDDYRSSLPPGDARDRFDALLAKASCTLALPGDMDDPADGYSMAGRATIAHCDLLLAVWDGLPPRGRGGTGEVVERAVVNGTPVVHVPIDPTQQSRLLWSAFDPAVVTQRVESTTERPLDDLHLAYLLATIYAPPADTQERTFLAKFADERLRRLRTRIEYPLMLALAGVARFDLRRMRATVFAEEIREEWHRYRGGCVDGPEVGAPLDHLERAYSYTDQLATHFAQTYRSGHIFNFVLGGLAVCLGLAANVFDRALLELAIVEGVITLGIILNTRIGVRNEWHRRWLDYRQLAERLRPMRSLKLLGLASPDPPGSVSNPVPRRWIDWYTAGVWRAMGCPAGAIDRGKAGAMAKAVADFEIAPQVAYHHRHAGQIEKLDGRLEKIAAFLFISTLVVAVIVIVGLAIAPDTVNAYDSWFTLIEAGFPALGTAVFGIRFQGDFGGSAIRSLATANALRQIETQLSAGVSLVRAADLTEQAARIMHGDLDEWRLVNEQQELDLV